MNENDNVRSTLVASLAKNLNEKRDTKMIPKIIHYCWFGGNPLPELAKRCIASWRKFLPNYEIWEWTSQPESSPEGDFESPKLYDRVLVFDVNIIPYTAEAYRQKNNQKVSKKWERMALESKGIITCSEFSKSEIINRFNVNPEKIEVVYWGMDTELFHQITQKELESGLHRLNLNEPYFLSVSCAAPRKNIRTLLKAYKKFSEKEVNHR